MKRELLIMGPMYPATLQVLEETYIAHKLWLAADRDALLASLSDRIDAVATSGTKGMDDATMAKLPKLKMISHYGVDVWPVRQIRDSRRQLADHFSGKAPPLRFAQGDNAARGLCCVREPLLNSPAHPVWYGVRPRHPERAGARRRRQSLGAGRCRHQ